MSAKILAYLAALGLAFVHIGFVSGLPYPLSALIIFLPLLLRDVVLGRHDWALAAGFIYGLAIDFSRPDQFGVFTLSFFGMTLMNRFLFENFFTNASLWSLVILSVLDQVFLYLSSHLLSLVLIALRLSNRPLSWHEDLIILAVQFVFNFSLLFFLIKDIHQAFTERFRHSQRSPL